MFTYPWKNDQKAQGLQFTAEVNYPFCRQFSQTEFHTHKSVLWNSKSVLHSLAIYVIINICHQYCYYVVKFAPLISIRESPGP